jgi:hypothetical protein
MRWTFGLRESAIAVTPFMLVFNVESIVACRLTSSKPKNSSQFGARTSTRGNSCAAADCLQRRATKRLKNARFSSAFASPPLDAESGKTHSIGGRLSHTKTKCVKHLAEPPQTLRRQQKKSLVWQLPKRTRHRLKLQTQLKAELITLLARGASNAKWRSGCLAPDRYVESIL